jgi:redox-sensitive bicupin YhaK (pirin superfamily)
VINTTGLLGALQHRDSLGTGSIIRPGEVQRMSAGTGVRHSEANPSADEPVHLLQIWIEPATKGLAPSYEQKAFAGADKRGRLRLVASPDGAEGSLTIHQDARIFATVLAPGEAVSHTLAPGRHAWLHVALGSLSLDGEHLGPGDGAAITGPRTLTLVGDKDAEALLFDLA